MRMMNFKQIPDEELKDIVGGEIFDVQLFMGFVSVLAVVVAILKLYMSEKGKINIGKDYGFEWS